MSTTTFNQLKIQIQSNGKIYKKDENRSLEDG